jgi:hypothetical protein
MTILEAIEDANTNAGITTLVFARTLAEFNEVIESFNFSDYPINVVIILRNNGRHTSSGRRKGAIRLDGYVLTRVSEEPLELRTRKAEHDYIQPMRTKAISFLTELIKSDITDPEEEVINDSVDSVYGFLSSHTFGVTYTITLPIVEQTC